MTNKILLIALIFLLGLLLSCGDSSTGTNPDGDDTETAIYSLSVDVSPSDGGSISDLDDSYEEGEEIEVQANPNEGYLFTGWTGDVESSDNPLSVTMEKDYNLTANFEQKSYLLTSNTDGEGTITEEVVQPKATDYAHGTVVKLTAVPDEGWTFVEWNGDLSGSGNPVEVTVDDTMGVTAVFEEQSSLKNKIVFVSDEIDSIEELFVVDPDGSDLTQLTFESEYDKWAPAVSPDGSQIAYTSQGDIFFMQADGSNITSFPYEGDEPNWSPDGTRITFTSQMDGSKSVYVADVDGSNLVRVTNDSSSFDADPHWSPAGDQIVFSRGYRFEDINIFKVNSDGSSLIQITNDDGDNSEPVWSPGGTKIAFVTDRHGYYDELYIMNADGSNAERLTSNSEIDSDPSWSPDGSEIVFSSNPTGDYQLFKIDVDTEEITEVTQAVRDWDRDEPSWSPAN